MSGLISRAPVNSFRKVKESSPRLRPVAMLKVSGVAIEREKRGNRFGEIVPLDFGDRAAHQRADQNQRRRRGVGGNRSHQRRAKHRASK